MKKLGTLLLAFVLVIALSSCATLENKRKITVSGTGSVSLTADIVSFSINVSESAPTTGEAQQLANKKVSQILAIVRSYGIEDKDITTTSLNFSTEYEWSSELQKSVKVGEEVSQTLYVKMRDLNKFTSLVDELGSSVSGISFYSVSFDAEDHTQALILARELAYEDAYNKALSYASSCGGKLCDPITITDSSSSSTTRTVSLTAKAMMNDAATESYSSDIPTGSLTVTVNTEVVFEIRF